MIHARKFAHFGLSVPGEVRIEERHSQVLPAMKPLEANDRRQRV